MKIAYIAPGFLPSQQANAVHIMKMCQAMAQEKHIPCLFAAKKYFFNSMQNNNAILKNYGIENHFQIRLLPRSKFLKGYDFALWCALRLWKGKYQLIYCRYLFIAAICSLLNFPTIYEVHMPPGGRIRGKFFRLLLRGRGLLRLVVISDALRKLLLERYSDRLKGIHIVVAHDGVDFERYRDLPSPVESRNHLGLSDIFTVGYVGSLYPGRGIELILNLAKGFPDIRFLVVGGDSVNLKNWKEEMKNMQLTNVCFIGYVPNSKVPGYLSACDILLMPYQKHVSISFDGRGDTSDYMSPLKLFEYMAAGRMIVSSDLPVLREVLNEQNSVLCHPEEIDSWAYTIKKAVKDEKWRKQLGFNARKDVQEYTWRNRVNNCLKDLGK